MRSTIYIYLLKDPETSAVRYVGKSRDPWDRLSGHKCSVDNQPVTHWIKALAQKGLRPALEIIEQVQDGDGSLAERKWIYHYFDTGVDLLNVSHLHRHRNRYHTIDIALTIPKRLHRQLYIALAKDGMTIQGWFEKQARKRVRRVARERQQSAEQRGQLRLIIND